MAGTLAALLAGITLTVLLGLFFNTCVFSSIALNYMLMGVAFSAAFSNMITEDQLTELTGWFHPILAVCLLAAIVDLGAPPDFHLILGAGLYTAIFVFPAVQACCASCLAIFCAVGVTANPS